MAMTRTLDSGKLRNITITGRGLTADVRDATASVKFGVAHDQITSVALAVNDTMDLSIFRSGVMAPGSSIAYGQWWTTITDNEVQTGSIGPLLSVTALSRWVTRLRAQTGAKNWGTTDVSGWVTDRLKEVGAIPIVQPGLGRAAIAREKGEAGQEKPNTWDVMVQMQKQSGVWLFEYGPRFVFARPSWIMANLKVRKTYDLWWTNFTKYHNALDGLPKYTHRPADDPAEQMTFRLVSPDADEIAPGDQVNMTGNVGGMRGRWIVSGVSYPFTVGAAVEVTCLRPIDPEKEPPPESGSGVSGVNAPSVAGRVSAPKTSAASVGGAAPKNPGLRAATVRWANSVMGRPIDMDGAFGAQCVDLTQHFNVNVVGGSRIYGNGRDWFANAPSGNYTRIPASAQYRVGDIVCWGPAMGGGYGHVAICMSDDWGVGRVRTLSQNPGPPRIMDLSLNGVQGYLRPKRYR